MGLLARTSRGRQLTAGGWQHLGLVPPAGSAGASAQPGLFDG
ncbi:MAG: hypothetical protein ACRDGB_10815 [Candidatus Limnocylindria bacterium]